MSGGKGGSQSSKTEIPQWLEDQYKQVFGLAQQAGQIGYQPYFGPDVAAFNPTQQLAMQNNIGAAQSFGMAPQGMQALSGMPQAQDFGNGVMGYSSGPLFEQALAEYKARYPDQAARYDAIYAGGDAGMPAQATGAPKPQYTELDKLRMMNMGTHGIMSRF